MRKCLRLGCDRQRAQGDIFCREDWLAIPQEMRDRFWATRPHSDARRGELLKVVRWADDNLPQERAQ